MSCYVCVIFEVVVGTEDDGEGHQVLSGGVPDGRGALALEK